MSNLAEKYPREVDDILAKYPAEQKRAAVMPLLYLAQRDGNYVTKQDMEDIGELLEITATEVASIVGFYSLYYDQPSGKYRIQVCTDLPCAMRARKNSSKTVCKSGHPGRRDNHRWDCNGGRGHVPGWFDHAPMFQVQDGNGLTYHEDQTVESALEFINGLRAREGKK